MKSNLKIGLGLAILLTLLSCASKQEAPKSLTEITVNNTGTYEMRGLQGCYYGEGDAQKCTDIDTEHQALPPGQTYNYFIRAEEKIRLVFPFDTIQRVGGVVYRPNCHILVDFFAYKEKRYFAEAQITAQQSNPERGFNCAITIYEQDLGSSQKVELKDVVSKIRYRTPQRNERKPGYVSNYLWK